MAYTGIIPKDYMIATAKNMEEGKLQEYYKAVSSKLVRHELEGNKSLKIGKLEVPDKYKTRMQEALEKAGYEIEHYEYYIIVRW
jgi:hypothetical protein